MGDIVVTNLALIGYLMPLSLVLVACLPYLTHSVDTVFQLGRGAAIGSFLLSVGLGFYILVNGAIVTPTIGIADVGISLRLDALSLAMCWLVTFLGALLIQFSRNYLDGDKRQVIFFSRLYLTIGAVLFLVLSGNLWQLVLAWIGTSLALHQLLVFYAERPRAIIAARKKFIVARLSDVCLIASIAASIAFSSRW